jgi:hypothetical protein
MRQHCVRLGNGWLPVDPHHSTFIQEFSQISATVWVGQNIIPCLMKMSVAENEQEMNVSMKICAEAYARDFTGRTWLDFADDQLPSRIFLYVDSGISR